MSPPAILRRWIARLAGVLAALTCAAFAGPTSALAAQRIIAIGDLHGDYAAWSAIARDSRVMDPSGHWIGGSAILVQLGDITDRGPNSLRIIADLRRLQAEAPGAGGKVVVLVGNHEAMQVTADLRYVDPGEYAAFATPQSGAIRDSYFAANRRQIEAEALKIDRSASPAAIRDRWIARTPLGWVEHRRAWSPDGELGRWARSNPAVLKIDGTLFVHGGISTETAKRPIDVVNRTISSALAKADDRPDSPLTDPLGPLWYRGLVTRDLDAEATRAEAGRKPLNPDAEVDAVLKAYGARRIVVGHTPTLQGIQVLMGGKLIRADTGNSRHYGGQLSWLEIVDNQLTPHKVARPSQ